MKSILAIILLFYIFNLSAQDKKSYLSISPTFSHFIPENDTESRIEAAPYNVCPGIEFLYHYKLGPSLKLGTGLSYQFANIISYASGSDKFIFGELSLPVLFTLSGKNNRFSVETGIYAGKFLHFEWYKESHSQWIKVSSYDPGFGYKEKNTFADLHLAVSFAFNKTDPRAGFISPFIRYRIAENWMNLYRESVYYGFKFTMNLNKLKKEA
jgi:hypothetical protein